MLFFWRMITYVFVMLPTFLADSIKSIVRIFVYLLALQENSSDFIDDFCLMSLSSVYVLCSDLQQVNHMRITS